MTLFDWLLYIAGGVLGAFGLAITILFILATVIDAFRAEPRYWK